MPCYSPEPQEAKSKVLKIVGLQRCEQARSRTARVRPVRCLPVRHRPPHGFLWLIQIQSNMMTCAVAGAFALSGYYMHSSALLGALSSALSAEERMLLVNLCQNGMSFSGVSAGIGCASG